MPMGRMISKTGCLLTTLLIKGAPGSTPGDAWPPTEVTELSFGAVCQISSQCQMMPAPC